MLKNKHWNNIYSNNPRTMKQNYKVLIIDDNVIDQIVTSNC
jgi:hypothetical protein